MRRRPTTIALLGVDGAGKTTQARRLADELRSSGIPAAYFENAGGRPVLDGLARRLGREDGRALIGPRGVVLTETVLRAAAISRSLLWSRLTGRVAVMDRYAYCQYALMAARGDCDQSRVRRVLGRYRHPDLVCFLVVPEHEAQRRVEARGRDREELAHLWAFASGYRCLPEWPRFELIDACGSEDEVAARIRAAAGRVLAR